METLVVKIDTKANASKILESVKLFRGVKKAEMVTQADEPSDLLADVALGLKQVKLIQLGKLQKRTLKQSLNGK
jgi:hypothetical protein